MLCPSRRNSGTLLTSASFSSFSSKVNKHISLCTQTLLCWYNSIFMCPPLPVETWVWLAALTVPSVWLRRPLARTTSLRSQKVSTEWRKEWHSSGIKLWWGLVIQGLFLFVSILENEKEQCGSKRGWLRPITASLAFYTFSWNKNHSCLCSSFDFLL